MLTKIAVVETDVKSLWSRLKEHIEDVRALRGTWTVVTIAIVGFIFAILGVTVNGFNGLQTPSLR
jgi:hypothetical protein